MTVSPEKSEAENGPTLALFRKALTRATTAGDNEAIGSDQWWVSNPSDFLSWPPITFSSWLPITREPFAEDLDGIRKLFAGNGTLRPTTFAYHCLGPVFNNRILREEIVYTSPEPAPSSAAGSPSNDAGVETPRAAHLSGISGNEVRDEVSGGSEADVDASRAPSVSDLGDAPQLPLSEAGSSGVSPAGEKGIPEKEIIARLTDTASLLTDKKISCEQAAAFLRATARRIPQSFATLHGCIADLEKQVANLHGMDDAFRAMKMLKPVEHLGMTVLGSYRSLLDLFRDVQDAHMLISRKGDHVARSQDPSHLPARLAKVFAELARLNQQVTDLQAANTREVERRRKAERQIDLFIDGIERLIQAARS